MKITILYFESTWLVTKERFCMFSPDSDWKTFHVKYVDEQLFNISVCHDAPCGQILATFRE